MDATKHNHDVKLHLGMQVFFHQKRLAKGEQGIFWRNKLVNQNCCLNNSTSQLVAIEEDVQQVLSKANPKAGMKT